MNTFEQECERFIKNANDARNANKKQEATGVLTELNSILETDAGATLREESKNRLGEKEYEKKVGVYQRRHSELSVEVNNLPDPPKSKITFIAEILRGATLWSEEYQCNVEVTEMKPDGTHGVRGVKDGNRFTATVPSSDLSKKR